MKPEISIILPAYNAENFIENAIKSVLKQTFSDFELIIINDGSTDSTNEVINKFDDGRIRLIMNETNQGLQKTLNIGLKNANGNYIARIDADDQWIDEDKLEKQINFLKANQKTLLLGTGAEFINGNNTIKIPAIGGNEKLKRLMLKTNNFFHSSVMFRKEVIDLVGYYGEDNSIKHVEDYDLWLRIGTVGEINNISEIMIRYNITSNSISSKNRINQYKKNIMLIKKYRKHYKNYWLYFAFNLFKLIILGILNLSILKTIDLKMKEKSRVS